MGIASAILIAAFVLLAGVNLCFFWAVGTFDPCRAAVLRIVQKQREAGQDLTDGIGVLFGPRFDDAPCHRSALRGDAPRNRPSALQPPALSACSARQPKRS